MVNKNNISRYIIYETWKEKAVIGSRFVWINWLLWNKLRTPENKRQFWRVLQEIGNGPGDPHEVKTV